MNRKLAKAVAKLAAAKLEFRFVDLTDLPMYNEDLWASPPESILRVKTAIETSDGVLFVTPEYNRSVSPVLKNAIDWGARPLGMNSWARKPLSIIGASPGTLGTALAQAQLRSTMTILECVLMGQPEVYLTFKSGLIGDDAEVTNEETRKFLADYVNLFAAWVARYKP